MERKDILAIYDADPEAVVNAIEQLIDTIIKLEERIKSLENQLNKNSRNSSKPPSTDAYAKTKPTVKSRRKKSGKKAGGQKGHTGSTLRMVDNLGKFGGKHLEKRCNFCHEQHGFMPQCSNCHRLFHGDEIIDCAECHTDAHAPNENTFRVTGVENDVCGACHADIQNKFEVYPTKHNDLDCSMCHSKHGAIPGCTNCHRPHDDTMTADDYQTCHVSAHQPTNVIIPESTLTSFCEGCHGEATYKMEESATKHSELPCAQCHTWHDQIPTCSSCHATPHGPEYADCGVNCHILAHNVWDMGGG